MGTKTTSMSRGSRTGDRSWMNRGACLGRGDLPWIADPDHTSTWELLAMSATCQGCPVLADCTTHATGQKVTAGFWAGRNHDPDAPDFFAGPGWAAETLPGFGGAA